jgi:hypothetical protein
MRWYGDGGAGRGAACAQLGTEVLVTFTMTALVGTRAFDRRSVVMATKTTLVCALVWGLDAVLSTRVQVVPRLLVDALTYAVLLAASGAVNWRETLAFARAAAARPAVFPVTVARSAS